MIMFSNGLVSDNTDLIKIEIYYKNQNYAYSFLFFKILCMLMSSFD